MNQVERLLTAATAAQREGNFARARQILAELHGVAPAEPRAHNMLGMMALAEDDPKGAVAAFERAIAGDPTEPALRLNLAAAARRAGDDEREQAALDNAIAIDQRNFTAWLRKAELHVRQNNVADGVKAWSAALALSKHITPLPTGLADTLARGGAWLAEQTSRFSAALDSALVDVRANYGKQQLARFDACIETMLGRRKIYTNQCEGIHYPFLPAYEFFDRALFPWMAEFEAHSPAIRQELLALLQSGEEGLEPYVQQEPGTPENIWSSLNHSLDWSAYFLWNYGRRIDQACEKCPTTAAALELVPRIELPSRAPTAFFSILKPKKHIPPHTGVTNARTIVHLPLIVPEGCRFRVGGETRAWVEGEAFAFDDTIEHEAWNDSDELRAVLILDVWNPYIEAHERSLLQAMCKAADSSGFNPGMSDAR
ncbi:aspartyl/asparaginyl beta-hydroxylase [Blastomonas natatoria]|uniref:Aspartyl/asparaginyl beta-hydroxylase n=1 Tax=Blastomonas natatoria TaxID=34015 RepID=A0A2V3VCM7_9SPHN|nr:aspartyl/asparaginyl beta-hydroxylase domain-containing protein [Blastomonas natatoria]PXW78601.1 aspartyl/asparaginyl beta-hydroxylase [Blastomonas natatoria]